MPPVSLNLRPSDCPASLTDQEAIEAAYSNELAEAVRKLTRGVSVLVECEKEICLHVLMAIRTRLKALKPPREIEVISGRPSADPNAGNLLQRMLGELEKAAAQPPGKVNILPHLDLLTTSGGPSITDTGREAVKQLYQNPQHVWLGFADPTLPLPGVVRNLFPHRIQLMGIPREKLANLITAPECRKFGETIHAGEVYRYVSGTNPVRLRRLLSALEGQDLPASPKAALAQLRQGTLQAGLEMPTIDLDQDIGGYDRVKKRIREEILEILNLRDNADDQDRARALEGLLPRGLIFWGPPGTGKTLFAKAMATALGASVQVVSGPELKSKWVGESEENLRRIFVQARQSAPSVIIFDEIDSFAVARGTFTGSGVEHSMVNQLLTEMDGFRKEELVFVVATTNLVEALDPALLRPGRFEYQIHVPYPGKMARKAILEVHGKAMGLPWQEESLAHAVRRTRGTPPGASRAARWSGDHLQAFCRSLARTRLRRGTASPVTVGEVEEALRGQVETKLLSREEARVVAGHECGHAVVGLALERAPLPERIALGDDIAGALGYVETGPGRRIHSVPELLDAVCVLLAGREAEMLLEGELSLGSGHDLWEATRVARELVEVYGMGGETTGVCHYGARDGSPERYKDLSTSVREALDTEVRRLLDEQVLRARGILAERRELVEALRHSLLGQGRLESDDLARHLELHAPDLGNRIQALRADRDDEDPE